MALFKRKNTQASTPETSVAELLLQGRDMIDQTAQAHNARWGLGMADRWDLDQTSGTIRWTFSDRVAEAPAQILGSFSPSSGTWLWAWANDSLLPSMRTASDEVRSWGERNGQTMLTTPKLTLTEDQVADLVSVAFRLSRASGFYRAPAGQAEIHLTFGTVTITTQTGTTEEFKIGVGP